MRTRVFWLVLAALFVSAVVRADDHKADGFGGGSYGRGSSLGGFHAAFAQTIPVLGQNLSWVADLSIYNKGVASFAFGGRFDFIRGHTSKLVPFGQFMVGGLHSRDGDSKTTGVALTMGGGLDILLSRDEHSGEGWGFRVQGDVAVRPGDAHNLPRLSFGVLYRWGRQRPGPAGGI